MCIYLSRGFVRITMHMMRSSVLSHIHPLRPIVTVCSRGVSAIRLTRGVCGAVRAAAAATAAAIVRIWVVAVAITIRVMRVVILSIQIRSIIDWLESMDRGHQ